MQEGGKNHLPKKANFLPQWFKSAFSSAHEKGNLGSEKHCPSVAFLFPLQTKVHSMILAKSIAMQEAKKKQEVPSWRYLGAIYCQVHA